MADPASPFYDPDLAQQADPAILTVLGEAGTDPKGQQAVASVLANRMAMRGDGSARAQLDDPKEGWEAWQDPDARAKTMARFPVGSAAYKQAVANVQPILTGETPPPYAYDIFYSPTAQSAKGRKPPAWAGPGGVNVGGNTFYAGVYHPADADELSAYQPTEAARKSFQQAFGLPDLGTPVTAQPGSPSPKVAVSGPLPEPKPNPLNAQDDAQHKAIDLGALGAGGAGVLQGLRDTVQSTILKPAAWIDKQTGAPLGTSLINGPLNLLTSFGVNLPTAAQYAQGANALTQKYEASPQANTVLGEGGRFGGQVLASAPLLAAGGEGLAAGAEALGGPGGAVLRFLAGKSAPALEDASALAKAANAGVRYTSQATHNALMGGAAAAMTGNDPLGGAVGGAVAGPALSAAAKGGAGVFNGARNLLAPFTESGRAGMADRFLAKMAENGPTTINADELVPGSAPTLDQATGNAGLAGLRRVVAATQPNTNLFDEREAANNAARRDFLSGLRGDQSTLEAMRAARDDAADAARSQAFANAVPADPAPVVDTIDRILAGPSGQRDAVQSVLGPVRAKLVEPIDLGNGKTVLQAESDPEQLYGIRQAITDALSPKAAMSNPSGQLAAKELIQVKNALDSAIEQSAPGYKQYLADFAEASKPINSREFLQNANLTDANGNPTLAKVQSVLEAIRKGNLKGGVNGPKSVTDEHIAALQTLRDDLARENVQALGRARGSDTFQNLATNNLMVQAGIPAASAGAALLAHAPGWADVLAGAIGTGARNVYAKQNPAVAQAVVNRLLHPDLASDAFNKNAALRGPIGNLLRYGAPYLPAVAGIVGGQEPQVAH